RARTVATQTRPPSRDPGTPAARTRDDRGAPSRPRHVAAVGEAIAAGVPVTGYHVWSILDNYEWSLGYSRRFGLVRVDFADQRRTIKDSGDWYRRLIAAAG